MQVKWASPRTYSCVFSLLRKCREHQTSLTVEALPNFQKKIYHIFRNICQIFRKNGKFRPKNLRDVHPNAWFAQQPFVLKAILRPTLFRHRISFRICRTWLLCCQPLFRGQPWQLRKGLIRHACCRRWQARTSPPACSMVSIMI